MHIYRVAQLEKQSEDQPAARGVATNDHSRRVNAAAVRVDEPRIRGERVLDADGEFVLWGCAVVHREALDAGAGGDVRADWRGHLEPSNLSDTSLEIKLCGFWGAACVRTRVEPR